MHISQSCITVTYFGGVADLTFDEWAQQFIQDDELALKISKDMLEIDYGHAWNMEQPPEYYTEFTVADRDELIRQRNNHLKALNDRDVKLGYIDPTD